MNLLHTERLSLSLLHASEHDFIIALLNTEGWIKFIGQRNVHTAEEAIAYIKKVNDNPSITYYTVKEKDSQTPVGLVTLIQRDYLDQPDIGFAFLPDYFGKGYAYEAAKALLDYVWRDDKVTKIHAVTLPDNESSIRLSKKLGLVFEKEVTVNEEVMHVYTKAKS